MSRPRIDVIQICTKIDENPDLSYLGEYGDAYRPGAVDREEQGDYSRGHFRYFYPAMTGEETGDPDSSLQDYRRMRAYNRGDWHMVGIWAEAQVSYPVNDNLGSRRLETLRSRGLWGIESDSRGADVAEVTREELADLRRHLETFGVDTSDFEEKAAEAVTQ